MIVRRVLLKLVALPVAIMLKSTPAYFEFCQRLQKFQQRMKQVLRLRVNESPTTEIRVKQFCSSLADQQIELSAKILFTQTLGLGVGLWSPVVLLFASSMPIFLQFAFVIVRSTDTFLGSFSRHRGSNQLVDITATAMHRSKDLQMNASGIAHIECAIDPDSTSRQNLVTNKPARVELDSAASAEVFAQALVYERFVSHILVPLPNKLMKLYSVSLVWLSIAVMLYDFDFVLGPWVLFGLLTLCHAALALFHREST